MTPCMRRGHRRLLPRLEPGRLNPKTNTGRQSERADPGTERDQPRRQRPDRWGKFLIVKKLQMFSPAAKILKFAAGPGGDSRPSGKSGFIRPPPGNFCPSVRRCFGVRRLVAAFRPGDWSPGEGASSVRLLAKARVPAFDGDKSPAQSGDKSPHSTA